MVLKKSYGIFLVCALATGFALAQPANEALVLKRATQLREGPFEASRSLVNLTLQSALVRLPQRQGPWLQVKTAAGETGWVHMFDIGSPPVAPSNSNLATGALRGLSSFFNRGSASGGGTIAPTSTIGIRGLGAEDLASAQPNLQAVARMEELRADAAQTSRYAANSAWVARAVDPLPVPGAAPLTPAASSAAKKEAF